MTSGTRIMGRDPLGGDLLAVTVDNGIIAAIERTRDPSAEAPLLIPGLVDLQVNGYGGDDVNAASPDPEAIMRITRRLRSVGVTTWVPTVITGTEAEIVERAAAVDAAIRHDPATAAAVPAIHVEGPFISDQDGARGVHDPARIRSIDAAEVERWRVHGPIGYVTVSPHAADAAEQIARIVAAGVTVAIGHTHASGDQIRAAADAGASLSTHLGNGIPALLPRHPNAIWAQLAEPRLRCGLIADGHHLPADAFTAMVRSLTPGRAFVVSDAVELAGSPAGRYRTPVGGEVELSADGRLQAPDSGLLAGSAANLAECLRWIVGSTPLGMAEAVRLTSVVPGTIANRIAREGWGREPGRLRLGAPADLCTVSASGDILSVYAGSAEV